MYLGYDIIKILNSIYYFSISANKHNYFLYISN